MNYKHKQLSTQRRLQQERPDNKGTPTNSSNSSRTIKQKHLTKYAANRRKPEEIVASEHVIHRVRRFYYDDYPFYYNNEYYYDYYDYQDPEVNRKSIDIQNN